MFNGEPLFKKLTETNAVMKMLKLCLIALSLVVTANSQADNEIAAGLPGSTSITSKITSNEWKIDTLVVHGTLTNTNSGSVNLITPALVGYDANRQEVNAGKIILANPELNAGQTEAFTAEISDPRKALKFTKLVGTGSSYHIATEPAYAGPTPLGTATPYATTTPP